MTSGPRISDSKDLYWLAGLLEGEGSFLKPRPSTPTIPRITIEMCDKDVIERVAYVFGVNYVYHRQPKQQNRKDRYGVASAAKNAFKIMQAVYPIMGERRKQQILAATNAKAINDCPLDQEYEIYWLVGLLEGEGTFLKGIPSHPNKPILKIQMNDRDVLDRVAQFFHVNVLGPIERKSNRLGDMPYYIVSKQGRPAVQLMQQIRPMMGERRQGQIDAAIASYEDRSGVNHPNVKLTVEQVREIRRQVAEGEKLTRLAGKYGVDISLIWQIKARRAWKDVE
ncbi:MAG: hypothetical protein F9K46_06315 [Anaerolineae bacterium]|nr:MAG: hypothetical protein F9K46_06315 [Anaerolineae bacterium]